MILEVSKTFKTYAVRASNDQMIMKRNAHYRPRLFQAIYHSCVRNIPWLGQPQFFLNQAGRSLAAIGWQRKTSRRKRENFSIAIGYANGMFKLGRQAFITRYSRPAIMQNLGF